MTVLEGSTEIVKAMHMCKCCIETSQLEVSPPCVIWSDIHTNPVIATATVLLEMILRMNNVSMYSM